MGLDLRLIWGKYIRFPLNQNFSLAFIEQVYVTQLTIINQKIQEMEESQLPPKMNCFQKQILLMQGGTQIYRTMSLNQPANIKTMIPLSGQPLPQLQIQFSAYLDKLNKTQYTSSDIWKGLISANSTQVVKCFFYYIMENSSFLMYSLIALSLLNVMYSEEISIDLKYIYILVLFLCLVWIWQNIFLAVGEKQIVIVASYIKGVLFYSLFKKVTKLQASNIKGELKGKILNTLTQFHDILQDNGFYLSEICGSIISFIGIYILIIVKLGLVAFLACSICSVIFIVILYCYGEHNSLYMQEISKLKDKRMSCLSETTSFLKYIKMQMWQGLFLEKILSIRKMEFKRYMKYGAGGGMQKILEAAQGYPIIVIILLFVNSFTSQVINSKFIMTSVLLILMLQKCLVNIVQLINCSFQLSTLFQRAADLFNQKHLQKRQNNGQQVLQNQNRQNTKIRICQLTYKFKENSYILNGINMEVKTGQFVTIVGRVGSGKTTFLDCIANQLVNIEGKIQVFGQISYVEQQPVIFSGILRNNITSDKPYDQEYYKKVVQLCCLSEDFRSLEKGDMTFIQEKITNLSGGQKARVALARALYSSSKILLLDDPLSGLDVRVGQHIYNNLGVLCKDEGYTIIMALHQLSFTTASNKIYLLNDGKIQPLTKDELMKIEFNDEQQQKTNGSAPNQTAYQQISIKFQSEGDAQVQTYRSLTMNKYQADDNQASTDVNKVYFLKTFFKFVFFSKINILVFPLTIIAFVLSEALNIAVIYFLANYDRFKTDFIYFQTWNKFIGFMIILVSLYFLFLWLRTFLVNICVRVSNEKLFKDMAIALLRSKLSFFKGKSSGDILDKFAVDLGALDANLMYHVSLWFNQMLPTLTYFAYMIYFKPILAVFLVALGIAGYFIHNYCAPAVIAQRQQSLIHKGSPILTHFQQTIKGIKTIRAYNLKSQMTQKLHLLIQNSMKACISYQITQNAYTGYGKHMTTFIMSSLFFVLVKLAQNNIKQIFGRGPTLLLFQINWCFSGIFSYTLYVSSVLVSIQRISAFISGINKQKESINLNFKQPHIQDQAAQLQIKQSAAFLQLRNLKLRYSDSSPLVLKNINFSIKKGQKVAIVGRTGSGKSTLVQVLYRLVEADQQFTYLLGGKDAKKMSLKDLRNNFSCIPQQPFIFNESIRKNIDPFNSYLEQQIQSVLSKLKLYQTIAKSQKGLQSSVEKKEISLSYGETQLICLARVVLEKKKILIMDEATSNIDENTESIIKAVIAEEFKDRVVICIAHKLLTILDYDQILVLDDGKLVERGSPKQLLHKGQYFYRMINENAEIANRSYKLLGLQQKQNSKIS